MRRPLPFSRPIVRAAQRFVELFGFRLEDHRPPFPNIKDAEYYRPLLQPWLMPEWSQRLRSDDPRSLVAPDSKYVLYCHARDAVRRCSGDLVECGVYKGGTAKILAELIQDRPIHLFDTFSGMPDTDPDRDLHKPGDFGDTSLNSVRDYLAPHQNIAYHPGLIPNTLEAVSSRTFAFVHVDLDIYLAIKSACQFFYPRLQSGGVFVFDDYAWASCPGARSAVDEFFSGKPETPIVMTTGQCVVQKL